jgi:lipopolysaccharide/colanic/teichoic acid biosynthesis glycosyltransferase
VLKRGVDIALSGVLLIVSLPLLAVAALIIKLDSEGPVFFRQARVGRNSRRFQILKLRSMRISGLGLGYTLSEDPRVTRIGRWLRWLKVDELPQLWNVLCGEMSMVGPRPVVPELALEYRQAYKLLLTVRPGLTDPATLKYCHEEQSLLLVPDPLLYYKTILVPDKLRISAAYIERANFWSDLAVLTATALALVPINRLAGFIRALPANPVSTVEEFFSEQVQSAEDQPSLGVSDGRDYDGATSLL